ncbi:tail fiber protein [Pseudomonas phage vB_PseuGesM_254]|uniref:Tail fiber protein n=1 Tax=Pseudomonas phage vB_PseuGesM_254 TaxID=3092638 RepID=A0AAX4G6J0_9CAUD|nr:tail fiber protein [Pseudomonas phage PseuGes_254]
MPNFPKPLGINDVWAAGGVKTPPGSTKINSGWVVEYPPYQMMNWVQNRQDSFIAHFNQHGIPEWDSVTEYQGNLSYAQGSDGIIYKAISTGRGSNPVDPLNRSVWVRAFEPFGVVAALTTVVNTHISNYQTLAGISNIVAARQNLSVWSRNESDVRYAALAGNQNQSFAIAASTQPFHAVRRDEVLSFLQPATETSSGVMRLATASETEIGALADVAVSPLNGAIVYLKKTGNLAGLTNVAAARNNLGLSPAATMPVASFLQTSQNLADVPDKSQARVNLGLTSTASQPETYFLRTQNNLADVPDKAAARSNLGLTSIATLPTSTFLATNSNLADVPDKGVARANLGLSDTATMPSVNFLLRANNLADITNPQAARNALGLGSLAIGSAFGVAGPNLDFTTLLAPSGYQKLPSGLILQWGSITTTAQNGSPGPNPSIPYNPQIIPFPIPFPNSVLFAIGSEDGAATTGMEMVAVDWRNNTNRTQLGLFSNYVGNCRWFAVGY